jgi:hypothetical protein
MWYRKPLFSALICMVSSAEAQSVSDYAVQVSAVVQTNAPSITLSWPGDPLATSYSIYRKPRDATTWGMLTGSNGNASTYIDTSVANGGAYEYAIAKSAPGYSGYGFIYSGIQVPLTESRGKLILLVDNTYAAELAMELARLEQDLAGDGWTVLRHNISRMAVAPADNTTNVWPARANELASTKALVVADYLADPSNVKAVFLFGHVPVPYSGDYAPDGHSDHQGAWPADLYYADMHGLWTDSAPQSTHSSDPRNWNFPGDGKFDQTAKPSDVDLEVGRVDMANLPSFALSEQELLRQYLNKDHNFRHTLYTARRRGLVDDNFGLLAGEVPAVTGWRNFAPFFGATNIFASPDWFRTLAAESYLWGYGCGSGTFTSAAGVGSTTDFANNNPQVVFTMLYGSYFGDWDSQNNFLRAGLATPTYTLTASWGARPNWVYHHMGLGETIGFSTRVSQNRGVMYVVNGFYQAIHIALMGDPSLRMHPVTPASGLLISTNSHGVQLSWTASPDNVIGYHIYRAPAAAGPFTRVNSDLIGGNSYTDPQVSSNVYMLRAVKLEQSASGTYYNSSQGIFQSLDGTALIPLANLIQPTNNTLLLAPTNLPIQASVYDPANSITNVSLFANGVKLADLTFPYSFTWTNVPAGTFSLSVRVSCSSGKSAISAPLAVRVGSVSPALAVTPLGNSSYAISGVGIPGNVYRLQYGDALPFTNWQVLGTVTSTPSGALQFFDSNAPPQRFYRSAYP